ncbi:MAG: helix-turn-helix domain-containing protein [Planctomycetes bacterium]|nr:helix-turn-helix domain-containing protein [Planctomycetota bacterium]
MNPTELRQIGEKLYGPHWQSKLAAALPVTTRTIRYWLAGKREIREVIARRIRSLEHEGKDANHG